jgi:UDP-N-acetylglucosamine acyltransferase
MPIHPTAQVDPRAQISGDATIGAYAVVGPEVTLDSRVRIGSHVVLEGRTRLGEDTEVHPFALLGGQPGHLKDRGEGTELVIGARVTIREHVSLHRGTKSSTGRTVIADDCAIFSHVHIGHDSVVDQGALIVNGAMIAGHVHIHERANIGGNVEIHQFVRIGALVMLGGGSSARIDVPPYCMASGDGPRLYGLNEVGLERRGLPSESVRALRSAYRTLFRSGRPRDQALLAVRGEFAGVAEVLEMADFIAQSQRGVARHAGRAR